MNAIDPKHLGQILDLLKTKGVRCFSFGELSVEFAPIVAPETAPIQTLPIEDEKCRCGHEMHAHSEQGFCLKGCDAEQCADAVK